MWYIVTNYRYWVYNYGTHTARTHDITYTI